MKFYTIEKITFFLNFFFERKITKQTKFNTGVAGDVPLQIKQQ